ncbi:hypothetical protein AA0X95_06100 [Bacillus sp. 1P10SD]|uniref:Ig-like domain-containing protein n=1 Tax=Bacillus sp. 1P10SD TaxID=3132265 RepID=UPI0039A49CD0
MKLEPMTLAYLYHCDVLPHWGTVPTKRVKSIATVDQNGVLQAGKKGKTTITVSYHGVKTELSIHVKQMPPGQKKK